MGEFEIKADIKNSKITYVKVSTRVGMDIASFEVENGVFYLDRVYTTNPKKLFLSFKEVLDTGYGSEVVLYQQDGEDGMEVTVDQSLIDSMFD